MWRHLRPAGESITGVQSNREPADFFKPLGIQLYASGTAALAAAISAACNRYAVSQPEVILPAYGCPSLVSAVLYCGAKPVLVDLTENQLSLDINALQANLTPNTVATVSVDLFGLPSITDAHRRLLGEYNCALIRDCAQANVTHANTQVDDDELIVISFGRGKPVSVLTGGAVLHSAAIPYSLPEAPAVTGTRGDNLLARLKFGLYNLVIKPSVYGFLDYLPIGIGDTRYSDLGEIAGMSATAATFLPANLNRSVKPLATMRAQYEQMFSAVSASGWYDLCYHLDPKNNHRLLRYAVLAPSRHARDRVLGQAEAMKLGMTGLYHQILPHIDQMPAIFSGQADSLFPNAKRLADRLITLPFYSDLSTNDQAEIELLISAEVANS